MNNLQIEFNHSKNAISYLLKLSGDLSSMNAVDFKNDFLKIIMSKPKTCIIDLIDVKTVDLTGLNAIAMIHSEVSKSGHRFCLRCQNDHPIKELMQLTKFDRVIKSMAA